jgi:hypothetical protein
MLKYNLIIRLKSQILMKEIQYRFYNFFIIFIFKEFKLIYQYIIWLI